MYRLSILSNIYLMNNHVYDQPISFIRFLAIPNNRYRTNPQVRRATDIYELKISHFI